MNRRTRFPRAAVGALGALLLAAAAANAPAQDGVDAIWNDPVFKKQFVGSYGINADIEPRVTPKEVQLLEKVRPVLAENPAKAEQMLARDIEDDSSAILDFTLGNVFYQQEKLGLALDAYRKAIRKFPSFRRAWRNMGLINAQQQNWDAAIAAFNRMIELGGGDAYSYGLLAIAHTNKQDYQPAEASYRLALLLQPDNTQWRLGLTQCVFKQGKFEDAASLLDVLIARYPDKPEFWMLQAQTFLGMKQNLKAAEDLEAVHLLGKSTLESLHTLGDIYVTEELPDLAQRAYDRAIDLDPRQPVARALHAAELLAARGATEQASAVLEHYKTAAWELLPEPDRRSVLKLQARLGMARGESSPETIAVLEQIVELDPLDGEALLLLGQSAERKGERDRAILYYERAANLEEFELKAKLRHAQTLVGMARYNDAVPLLRRVLEIERKEDVARYLEQVERVARARR